jgi:putative ABC transport system permease protein
VRQLAIETSIAACAGGALGLLLAAWGVRLAIAYGPPTVPRLASTSIDGRAVMFAVVVSMLSALLIGILPAFAGTGARPVESLRNRSGTDASTGRLQRALVSGQIGVALVLLVASLVLVSGFLRLRNTDLGFRTADIVSMRVALTGERYATNEARVAFFEQLLQRLEASPEIGSAGASDSIPLSGSRQGSVVSRAAEPERDAGGVSTRYSFITPKYLETIGIRLVRGRLFARDESTPGPILLNETAARRLFADSDPLGRQVRVGFESLPRVVVGIVGDERHVGPGRAPDANVYIPAFQYGWTSRLTVAARVTGSPEAALSRLRAVAREVDPTLAPYDVRLMSDMAGEATATERFLTLLLAVFAITALALSAIGVYGVTSCHVSQQMHDFGVRLALGARTADIARMVLTQVAVTAAAGVAIGVLLLAIVRPFLSGIIAGSPDVDAALAAAPAALLPLLSLAAALRPTRRAMGADPLVALRQQ